MTDEKVNIKREDIKKNLLKKVLIRIDYDGVASIDNYVEAHYDLFGKYFSDTYKGSINNATIDRNSLDEIADRLSLDVKEFRKEPLHFFRSPKREVIVGSDDVELTISTYYAALDIKCKNYQTIDQYIGLIEDLFRSMFETFKMFKIRRVAIRKISGGAFDTIEALNKVYEPLLFFGAQVSPNAEITFFQREYRDTYILADRTNKVNYAHKFRTILYNNHQLLQTVLDTDVYCDEFCLQYVKCTNEKELKELLYSINKHQFDLFKDSVTIDYLKSQG